MPDGTLQPDAETVKGKTIIDRTIGRDAPLFLVQRADAPLFARRRRMDRNGGTGVKTFFAAPR